MPKQSPRRYALLAAAPLLALALGLSGCTAAQTPVAEPTVTATPEPVETVTPEPEPAETGDGAEDPYGPQDTYPARYPLTGMGTQSVPDRPALLVKVENSNVARPQAGLEVADIVYEVVVEGGITRYIAVFHSQLPESVLPVRSARPVDIPLVTPYGGVFAYSGAQGGFIQAINNAGNQSLIFDSGHRGLARVSGRSAPHNVAATPMTLLEQANSTRVSPPPATMTFAREVSGSTASVDGSPVSTIDVRMSNVQRSVYNWDQELGKFLRSDGNTPSISVAGERLAATNVVVLFAPLSTTDIPGTSPVPVSILTGSGRAIFAADGRYIEGTWRKAGNADAFEFLDANGRVVNLAPGNTWIQIAPDNQPTELS
jgi:hypothetical protein